MFKEWLKQFLAVSICTITILSSFSPAFADNYIPSDSGSDATYYIIEGKDVEKLFDFTIYDIPDIVSWIFQFKTYTVIKKYDDSGETIYKGYFNTPNLQSICKNRVISSVDDGYTDDTYKIEDTEWVVKVGKNATTENVITKYGFQVPSYTYMGEYPKEVMSTAGILPNPKHWWEVAWRAIKSLFGVSFLKAPDADNFNTITYLNHEYKDKSDYILDFFKLYYLDYFERQIPVDTIEASKAELSGEYFSGPEEVIELAVTEEAYSKAKLYNETHSDEYKEACQRMEYWDAYESAGGGAAGIEACLSLTTLVGNRKYDAWHFLASIPSYNSVFLNWVNANPNKAYIMINAACGSFKRYGGSGTNLNRPAKYGITTTEFTENEDLNNSISLAADILKYTETSTNFKAHVSYQIQTRTRTITEYSDSVAIPSGYTIYNEHTDIGPWTTTITDEIEEMVFTDTEPFRDDPEYYDNYSYENGPATSSSNDDKEGPDDTSWTVWSETTYTQTEIKYINYKIIYLYAKNDTTNTMTYDDYKDFIATCSFESFTFDKSDFIPAQLQNIYNTYLKNQELMEKHDRFIELLKKGDDQPDDTSKKELLYRQCLITNESEKEDECWSRKYGDDKTSLTTVHVYAYSRIWTVTEDYPESKHELTDADTHEILTKLEAYCGPYYSEVISNMMKIMCATAKNEGNMAPLTMVISDDKRVMPYDTASLLARDRENYGVNDPRVELYKTHVVGKLISDFAINPLALGIYIKPQKTIVKLAGRITEFSVFMQQLCNFDVLDGYGLSPANMWVSGYVTLMMCLLAVFFIFKTVVAIIKMGTQSGAKLILAFFILVFELGLITATFANPTKVWTMIKNVDTKVINLGEMSTIYSVPELTYLYGTASDMEVTYYMPYLDTWSKYNTGYGILKSEQVINDATDYRETVEKEFPTIGGVEVKHWSVLLMDSFHYWGYSNSVANTVTVGGHTYNGSKINNNAYRVVDHFLAPRVTITDNGDSLSMSTRMNENYNGEFQSGMLNLIVKLLNCILCCLLSLIKMLTFLWQWFVLYIFIFRVILGRGAEGKPMGRIILETFAPTIAMIMIGLYAGIVMFMGMDAEGIFGLLLEIFLFWLTFMMIRWWHDFGRQVWFPNTLIWMYWLTNLSRAQQRLQQDRIQNAAKNQDIDNDMPEEYSNMSLEEQRDVLFDENGNRRSQYRAKKYDTQVMNWYNRAKAQEGPAYNKMHDEQTRRQMRNLEHGQDNVGESIREHMAAGKIGQVKLKHVVTAETQTVDKTNRDVKDYTYRTHIDHKSDYKDEDRVDAGHGISHHGIKTDDGIERPSKQQSERPDNQQSVNDMYGDGPTDSQETKTGSGSEKKKNPPKIGGVKD